MPGKVLWELDDPREALEPGNGMRNHNEIPVGYQVATAVPNLAVYDYRICLFRIYVGDFSDRVKALAGTGWLMVGDRGTPPNR
jgi:hypothetical protein